MKRNRFHILDRIIRMILQGVRSKVKKSWSGDCVKPFEMASVRWQVIFVLFKITFLI